MLDKNGQDVMLITVKMTHIDNEALVSDSGFGFCSGQTSFSGIHRIPWIANRVPAGHVGKEPFGGKIYLFPNPPESGRKDP